MSCVNPHLLLTHGPVRDNILPLQIFGPTFLSTQSNDGEEHKHSKTQELAAQ